MTDITVIILTKDEEKNIEASICSAKQIAKRIIVVDSGSTDRTVEIAKSNGADTFYHEWPGYAAQFNWAIDNCNIETEWIFRLDADERISEELALEIHQVFKQKIQADGYKMRLRLYFMNKWIKHGGTHKLYFLRLFRYGKGRVENIIMDEHVIVDGSVEKLNGDLIHYDYKGLDAWSKKHVWYSQRELQMYNTQRNMSGGNVVQKKKRRLYYRLPIFIRARLYYWFRYYGQLGFLDGTEGKIFIYLQAYWYRFLVDAMIFEQEKTGKQK